MTYKGSGEREIYSGEGELSGSSERGSKRGRGGELERERGDRQRGEGEGEQSEAPRSRKLGGSKQGERGAIPRSGESEAPRESGEGEGIPLAQALGELTIYRSSSRVSRQKQKRSKARSIPLIIAS